MHNRGVLVTDIYVMAIFRLLSNFLSFSFNDADHSIQRAGTKTALPHATQGERFPTSSSGTANPQREQNSSVAIGIVIKADEG